MLSGGAEGRNEVELLVDHGHARAEGVERRADRPLDAVDEDPPGVGADGTAEDLHESALPGAVFAEEREDLAAAKLQMPDAGKRLHAGIAFRDSLHREQRRCGHRSGPCRSRRQDGIEVVVCDHGVVVAGGRGIIAPIRSPRG
jgi:hypothetical protein